MKRIFYIADLHLSVFHWYRHQCIASYTFNLDSNGLENFKAYLSTSHNITTRILLDLMDEDFKIESIPHVNKTDRQSIISRLIDKHYRNSKHYIHSSVIGRENQGRKDDVLRMVALRNPDTLNPWLALIEKAETAISSIYSVPLLLPILCKKLSISSPNVLIVYQHQSANNTVHVRQTFIKNNTLLMSRLSIIQIKKQSVAQQINQAVKQTHLFLSHDKKIDHNDTLEVHVLVVADSLSAFHKDCTTAKQIKYHFHSINKISSEYRLSLHRHDHLSVFNSQLIFSYLCHSLCLQPSHYSQSSLFNAFHTQLSSKIIYASCTFILITSSLYAINNMMKSITLKNETRLLNTQINSININHEKIFAPITPKLKQSQSMQSSVLLVETIHKLKTISPLIFMSNISQAIKPLNLNTVQIDQFIWQQSSANNKTIKHFNFTEQTYHYAKINGRILNPSNDIKEILKQVSSLKNKLHQYPLIKNIKLLNQPFDIHSTIKSSANKQHNEYRFEFEILMKDKPS